MGSIKTEKETIHILTRNEVETLHTLISQNYDQFDDMDPVSPAGIKFEELLQSAVDRQLVGSGKYFKYSNCFSNCASLMYGVIKNHSFHNGNKRTGLLCMIKHLYKNGYVLKPDLRHQDIYDLIIAIDVNQLVNYANKHKLYKKWLRRNRLQKSAQLEIDNQILFIEYWLRTNSISKNVSIKSKIKLSKLQSILESKGLNITAIGTKITVFREVETKFLGFKTGKKKVNEKTYSLGKSLTEINRSTLKKLRRDFNLTANEGVDNIIFYDDASFIDEELNNYRRIIYKLAKK